MLKGHIKKQQGNFGAYNSTLNIKINMNKSTI